MSRRPRQEGAAGGRTLRTSPRPRRSQLPYLIGALLAIAAGGFIMTNFTGGKDQNVRRGPVIQQGIAKRSPAKPKAEQNQAWYQNQSGPPKLVTAPSPPLKLLLPEEPLASANQRPRAYEEELPKNLYQPDPPQTARLKSTQPNPALPVRPGDLPLWQRHAVSIEAVTADPPAPMIAIVIDDAGVDRRRTARVAALPGPLTISYLTYASGLAEQTSIARAAGHELMVHVAMEPTNRSVDPGPRVLRTGFDAEELLLRLRWGLSQFEGYVGINNHMGSRFTENTAGMRIVLAELKTRGLLFLDSRTSQTTVGGKIARELDLPFAERNIFLDHDPKLEVVNQQIKLLERDARRRGYAVAIGHPRDATLDALEAWLPTVASKGMRLVPISTIVARRRGVVLAAKPQQ